jgi:hypothetical protein
VVPFDHKIGSASAMLGFLQNGISVFALVVIGAFALHTMTPVVFILSVPSWIGLEILPIGSAVFPSCTLLRRRAPICYRTERRANSGALALVVFFRLMF